MIQKNPIERFIDQFQVVVDEYQVNPTIHVILTGLLALLRQAYTDYHLQIVKETFDFKCKQAEAEAKLTVMSITDSAFRQLRRGEGSEGILECCHCDLVFSIEDQEGVNHPDAHAVCPRCLSGDLYSGEYPGTQE